MAEFGRRHGVGARRRHHHAVRFTSNVTNLRITGIAVIPTHAVLNAQGASVAAPASVEVRDGATTGQPMASVDGMTAYSLADGSAVWPGDLPGNPAVPLVAADAGAQASTFAFRTGGCGAASCAPVASLTGVGHPAVVAQGQLYTGTNDPGVSTTLHAVRTG